MSVTIRPEHVRVLMGEEARDPRPNTADGVVAEVQYLGEAIEYLIEVGELRLKARQPAGRAIAAGERVRIQLPEESCAVLKEPRP